MTEVLIVEGVRIQPSAYIPPTKGLIFLDHVAVDELNFRKLCECPCDAAGPGLDSSEAAELVCLNRSESSFPFVQLCVFASSR